MSEKIEKLGGYHIVHRIGEGGLSEVYLALKDGTPYAVKCLKPDRAKAKRYVDDFIREVKISTTLKHPNILGFQDNGVTDGTYFGVMEAVVGISTYELIVEAKKNRTAVPVSASLFIIQETLKALSYIHRTTVFENSHSNTFHGDLSPANIMIAQDGRVLLTDFGSAGQNTPADPQETHLGKMYYLPADVLDRGAVTTETDLYALGVVAFYLLFGERPFESKDKYELYKAIKGQDIPRLECSHITRSRKDDGPLRIFFNRALNKDKNLRFKTAQEFFDAFFAIHFLEAPPRTRLEFLSQLNRIHPNLFTKVSGEWSDRIEGHRSQEYRRPNVGKASPVVSLLAKMEKRRYPRVSTHELNLVADVFAQELKTRLKVPVVELSQGGMLVKWEGVPPKIGKEYPISVKFDAADAVETKGKLLYEVHRKSHPYVAFQFMDITQAGESVLKGYVAERLGKMTFSEKVLPMEEETTNEDFVEVYFKTPGEFKEEFDRNICHGGMYVQSTQTLPINEEVLIRIQVANFLGRAVLKARVVQVTPQGAAIQFIDPPPAVKTLLEEHFDLKL